MDLLFSTNGFVTFSNWICHFWQLDLPFLAKPLFDFRQWWGQFCPYPESDFYLD